jgi:hypothetical protein
MSACKQQEALTVVMEPISSIAKDVRSRARSAGRPRKFRGPSRVVTLTLPEETIRKLALINTDRAKAIVAATEIAAEDDAADTRVDMLRVKHDLGVITVPLSKAVESIPNVNLVRVSARRYLLVLSGGTSIADVEIALLDQLEAPLDSRERSIVSQLLDHIRANRRLKRVQSADLILFNLE